MNDTRILIVVSWLFVACSAGQDTWEPPAADDAGVGAALIRGVLVPAPCRDDRIRKIYAIPANLGLGQTTSVEVEVPDAAMVGKPHFDFVLNGQGAVGMLGSTPCAERSSACRAITCSSVLAAQPVDPDLGYRIGELTVGVLVYDDQCSDTELITVECLGAIWCGGELVPCGTATSPNQCPPCAVP